MQRGGTIQKESLALNWIKRAAEQSEEAMRIGWMFEFVGAGRKDCMWFDTAEMRFAAMRLFGNGFVQGPPAQFVVSGS